MYSISYRGGLQEVGPGGDQEGGEQAFAVAEAVLPGVGPPAAVLEPDAAQEPAGFLTLELGAQYVCKYPRFHRGVSGDR